jgi:hypothetical protein
MQMEREFFTDDFENLLRENADQFKMAPSKKVWHGIYNDLHPGRRWPSAMMSLIFIFSLVIVGHLNTQQNQRNYLTNLQSQSQLQKSTEQQNLSNGDKSNNNSFQRDIVSQTDKNVGANKTDGKVKNVSFKNLKEIAITNSTKPENNFEPENTTSNNAEVENVVVKNNVFDPENLILNGRDLSEQINTEVILTSAGLNFISKNSIGEFTKNNLPASQNNTELSNNGNKTTHAPVLKIRRNPKISWTYYISPLVSYRKYSGSEKNVNANFNSGVTHKAAPGLEAGIMMEYSLTKKLKFISGFQANYSAYTVQANNIHPIMASLLLYSRANAPYLVSSISFYGNGPGAAPVNLHNYSLQVSLPVGLEYKLAGDNEVQLNAFGSLQPSFVVANRAYILSTDKKNYITQSSLLRDWNMSSNIGTFVSFKSYKFNWQIGPELHYQLFSSYNNTYQLREHFIDYGVRVGVSIVK